MEREKKGGFTSSLGFVLSAAGSAVGVGNIWRFPYLAANDGYFVDFITSPVAPIVYMLVFLAVTAFIVYRGVEKGIEKFSKIVMPGLIFMIIGIAVFSLTLNYQDADGAVRTGLQGLAVYLIPNFDGLTVKRFFEILLDAMSQLFFSLSVSMGIMITYGAYVKKDTNLSYGKAIK